MVMGFGISALSVNGAPIPNTLPRARYDTGGIGGALIGVGAAAAIAGVVTIVLPGPKQKVRVSSLFLQPAVGSAGLVTYW